MTETSYAAFREALQTTFTLTAQGVQVQLRLAEVTEGRSARGIEQFSLIFHGPASPILQQGTYEFAHDTLGSMALFIVPLLESTTERMVYEAAFVRPVPQA